MGSFPRQTTSHLLSRMVSKAKILSAERERDLLVRYHATNDKAAIDELVRAHMPIIFRVASRSAQSPGVDIEDLVQTATEGLLIAINRWSFAKSDAAGMRFALESEQAEREQAEADANVNGADSAQAELPATLEPETPRSSRLATYAMWWMRSLLTENVIEHRGMVARAKSLKTRKALFGLPRAIKDLDLMLPLGSNDILQVAEHLGVDERDIEEALLYSAGDVMLDEPVGDGNALRGEVVPDERAEGEEGILSRLTATDQWNAACEVLMALPPRERFVLVTRYLLTPKWKLDRLSDTLKMSRERIRQIGDDSLSEIRRRLAVAGVSDTAVRRKAARDFDAIVRDIERAAVSRDPADLERLMRDSGVKIGPSRPFKRRSDCLDRATAFPGLRRMPSVPARGFEPVLLEA